jgi:hypothetical protein
MNIDIVPMGELVVDHFRRDRIVSRDVVDREVEDDAPAEGDTRRIRSNTSISCAGSRSFIEIAK